MPSSYTDSLRLIKQAPGEGLNVWGSLLNNGVFDLVDSAIAGFLAIAITGDYDLSTSNGMTDEARTAMLKFTGTPANNATITLPSVSKGYLIWNATNKALTFTTGAGSTVVVDASDVVAIFCDASNVKTPGYGGLSNKDYIAAAVLSASGSLPATSGNAGKYVYTDGSTSYWKQVQTTDLGDYSTSILGVQVALAVAL